MESDDSALDLSLSSIPESILSDNEFTCLTSSTDTHSKNFKEWIVDSWFTAHMTFNRSAFSTYSKKDIMTIDIGANSTVDVVGNGNVSLTLRVANKSTRCEIKDVKHVPTLRYQLLSVSSMAKIGIKTVFDDKRVYLIRKDNGSTVSTGTLINGLYILDYTRTFCTQ